jgi:hypothetical protein
VPITVKELSPFEKWADGAMTDHDRQSLAVFLAYNPLAGDVIPGTGGIRKVRWARPGRGKRGGFRIIYYYHDEHLPIYLITGYAKGIKDDLSPREKQAYRTLVQVIQAEARSRLRT